jgi:hypothetical protein
VKRFKERLSIKSQLVPWASVVGLSTSSVSKNGYQSNHSYRLSASENSVSKNGYQSNHSCGGVCLQLGKRFKERLSIKSQL